MVRLRAAMAQMGDESFQRDVLAQLHKLEQIPQEEVERVKNELRTKLGINSETGSLLLELPNTGVTPTTSQYVLDYFSNINAYIIENPEQQQAVTLVVALAQGPKGIIQLAVMNAVGSTPLGEKLAELQAGLGK